MGEQAEEKNSIKHICTGLFAHVDAGKTTLSEAMLFMSGNIRRAGRVDKGDTFLDTNALERARGITIFSKQAILALPQGILTLLDTPGHVDFSAETERVLSVLDYAILVVSGADGVQAHTRTLFGLLKRYRVPVFLFINKMDQPGTDKERLIAELRAELNENCVDFSDTSSQEFFESVAVCREDVLEEYLENGQISAERVTELIAERRLFPCYFGSALHMDGVMEFLNGFFSYARERIYPEEFGARVFKIARDAQGARLTYLKVTGGSLMVRQVLAGERRSGGTGEGADLRWEEKVSQIRIYSGEKYETVDSVKAGGVCTVTGLNHTYPGQGLGAEREAPLPILEPVLNYQLILPDGEDPVTMLAKLRILEEEDPQLHVAWNEHSREILLQVMGEVQIEVLKSLILERFGVEVAFGSGNIVYRETIADTVEGVGHFEPLRHYAEVHLLLEPGERGSGLVFSTDCREELLAKNWQRLILTHLAEREHPGVLTGAAITDMKLTLVAGRAHLKHTEGGDFRQATYRAVRQGLMQAESVLLEPYYEFVLDVPEESVGRAMTDIERLYGKVSFGEENGSRTEGRRMRRLVGSAPVSTMQNYQREVTAYTKGEGRLTLTLGGYFPCHNTEEVLAQIGYDAQSDLSNPASSVFCAHGAGFVVPWDEVFSYMHLPPYQTKGEDAGDLWMPENMLPQSSRSAQDGTKDTGQGDSRDEFIGTEEIDRILAQTYNANKRDKSAPRGHGKGAWKLKRGTQGQTGGSAVTRTYAPREPQTEYLLVDGYNIIFAWEELSELAAVNIDGARGRLLDILGNYQGVRGCEVIVVFDAYRVAGHQTEVFDYHNIHVVYTKEAETADQYIEKFAHENAKKYRVTVATSDGLEQIIIRGEGCFLLSARELAQEIEERNRQLWQDYEGIRDRGRNYVLEKGTKL